MPAPSAFLERRHAVVRGDLSAGGLDALVVTHPPNILYLTNHSATAGVLVVARDAIHLVSDFRYTEAVRLLQQSEHACPGLLVHAAPASYDERLVELLQELGVERVGIEASHMSVARFEWLRRTAASREMRLTLLHTERLVERARTIKDTWELQALRTAAARLGAVSDAAFGAVRPGVSEREVAGVIERALRAAGFDRIAFDTIVASGPHAALPHHRAGDRILQGGEVVVLDFGGVLDGYCCDLTRTVAVGTALPEAIRVHESVREAQAAAIRAVRPGVSASAVDSAARSVLEARGLGKAFGHGTGHGLGLEVHEEPRIGRPQPNLPATVLQPGMVFTIEPGAYLPGWGGVRIEDDVAVTEEGCEVLTSVSRDLQIQ